jgi:radical SAM protein with 4Fe4S-binding SPASM domain
MSKSKFLEGLKPGRLLSSVRKRGVKASAFHALRRAGTMTQHALVGPEIVRINPMGYVCNHTCPMCWLQHLDPEELKREKTRDRAEGLKLADYVRLFDGMPAGVREINIVGGGEPLVHPDCVDIMAEVKKRRMKGSLISNGTLMKESVARRMVEMGWDSTRISVHAGDAETYQKIQGVDRFETMRTNLATFNRIRTEMGKRHQCSFLMFHVVQRENIPTIDKLFTIAEEVGVDFIEFDKIIPYDDGKWLTADELKRAQEALQSCARDSKVPCNIGEILPELHVEEVCAAEHKAFVPGRSCSVGFDQSFITADGNVLPCCFSSEVMGNVKTDSFDTIWQNKKYDGFRKRLINGKFAKYCITNRCALPDVIQH